MNKTDLADRISSKQIAKLTKKEISQLISLLLKEIEDALISGEKVSFEGFGVFEVLQRAEKKGKPFGSKVEVVTPAYIAPVFHPSKLLKDRLQILLNKGF